MQRDSKCVLQCLVGVTAMMGVEDLASSDKERLTIGVGDVAELSNITAGVFSVSASSTACHLGCLSKGDRVCVIGRRVVS